MKLFRKNKQAVHSGCDEKIQTERVQSPAETSPANIQILGSGCAKCNALEQATKLALEELNMDTAIDHVTDFAQIAAYGVMTTPALVVDGTVVSSGKVLKKEQVKILIEKARTKA